MAAAVTLADVPSTPTVVEEVAAAAEPAPATALTLPVLPATVETTATAPSAPEPPSPTTAKLQELPPAEETPNQQPIDVECVSIVDENGATTSLSALATSPSRLYLHGFVAKRSLVPLSSSILVVGCCVRRNLRRNLRRNVRGNLRRNVRGRRRASSSPAAGDSTGTGRGAATGSGRCEPSPPSVGSPSRGTPLESDAIVRWYVDYNAEPPRLIVQSLSAQMYALSVTGATCSEAYAPHWLPIVQSITLAAAVAAAAQAREPDVWAVVAAHLTLDEQLAEWPFVRNQLRALGVRQVRRAPALGLAASWAAPFSTPRPTGCSTTMTRWTAASAAAANPRVGEAARRAHVTASADWRAAPKAREAEATRGEVAGRQCASSAHASAVAVRPLPAAAAHRAGNRPPRSRLSRRDCCLGRASRCSTRAAARPDMPWSSAAAHAPRTAMSSAASATCDASPCAGRRRALSRHF